MRKLVSFAIVVLTIPLALSLAAPVAHADGNLHVFAGLGFGKAFEDGAASGGIGVGAGLMHQFTNSQLAIGGEAAWLDLGDNVSTFPVTGQVYYLFPSSGSTGGYVDAGAGLYSTSVDIEGGDSVSDSDLGINAGGGVKFGNPERSIRFGVDGKFHIIMSEGESTKVGTTFFRIFFN